LLETKVMRTAGKERLEGKLERHYKYEKKDGKKLFFETIWNIWLFKQRLCGNASTSRHQQKVGQMLTNFLKNFSSWKLHANFHSNQLMNSNLKNQKRSVWLCKNDRSFNGFGPCYFDEMSGPSNIYLYIYFYLFIFVRQKIIMTLFLCKKYFSFEILWFKKYTLIIISLALFLEVWCQCNLGQSPQSNLHPLSPPLSHIRTWPQQSVPSWPK